MCQIVFSLWVSWSFPQKSLFLSLSILWAVLDQPCVFTLLSVYLTSAKLFIWQSGVCFCLVPVAVTKAPVFVYPAIIEVSKALCLHAGLFDACTPAAARQLSPPHTSTAFLRPNPALEIICFPVSVHALPLSPDNHPLLFLKSHRLKSLFLFQSKKQLSPPTLHPSHPSASITITPPWQSYVT